MERQNPRGRAIRCSLLGMLLLTGLLGCGQRLRPVEGRVVFKDGQPLKGGMVIFEPMNSKEQPQSPRGDIDNDGRFRMSTAAPGDGVQPGTYRVYLTAPFNPRDVGKVRIIPEKYENPTTSGIVFDVTDAKKELTITLERP